MGLMHVRRFWVAGIVLIAVVALLPFSFHAERHLETATRVEGSQAETVRQELSSRFHSPFVDQVVLVVQGLPPADSEPGGQALATIEAGLKDEPGVSGIVSYLDLHDPIFLGKGGGTFVLIGLASTDNLNGPVESLIPALHQQEHSLENQLRSRYPAVKLELTGEIPLNFDIRKASADEVEHSESLAIPATLALLLLAFGSVVAALIPLAVGELAIATTLAITGLLAARFHLSILVQNLATMLGLGLGIDYALLMVSRFREALCAGQRRTRCRKHRGAPGRTHSLDFSLHGSHRIPRSPDGSHQRNPFHRCGWNPGGGNVCAAGQYPCTGGAGVARSPDRCRSPALSSQLDAQWSERTGKRWRRWGMVIVAHPWRALFLAGAPIAPARLAGHAARYQPPPRESGFPQAAESVQALNALGKMGRNGVVESLRIVVELARIPFRKPTRGGMRSIAFSKQLASDPRCDRVISITTLADSNRSALDDLSRETRRTFLSSDGRAALIEVMPATSVSLRQEVDWVRELRKTGATALTGVPGATLLVGGIPALNADYQTIVADHFVPAMALVVLGTLVALLCGFRSLFAPVKAIALNLLSVAASFGALVLVFQDGHRSALLGVPGGTGSVFPLVPIVAFAIVFGLSMDYEVFLVARVLEARRSGSSEMDAIPEGLARTAGLITSAAAIMIVVFAAFTLGNFLVVKMIGFTLAIAVLIDATLVRIVIGPALLRIAGDWNWWPGGLTKPRNSPAIVDQK